MNYKIVSFGDSFVFGSELQDNYDGSKSWIGLAANKLGVDYTTLATPGCGNDAIARQIYHYFNNNKSKNVLAVINWTWASRWDFYLKKEIKSIAEIQQISKRSYSDAAGVDWPSYDDFIKQNFGNSKQIKEEIFKFINSFEISIPGKWFTLGDTCAPEKLKWIENDDEALKILEFYKTFMLNKSLLWNNFRSLQTISSVQNYLENKKVKFVQTYMDYDMFNKDELINDDSTLELQKLISSKLQLFHNNLNFLDWAKMNNFPVTKPPGDHPLEEAHYNACELWIERYQEKLFHHS